MYICSLFAPVPGIEPRSPTTSPAGALWHTSTVAHNAGEPSKPLEPVAPAPALRVGEPRRATLVMTLKAGRRTVKPR